MQKFFDMLACRFAECIERGFMLACDRLEALRWDVKGYKALEDEKTDRKAVTNGKK